MRLNLVELRAATNRILDHIIEDQGVTTLDRESVFYWAVSADDRYDMSKDPPGIDVGSLKDDWEFSSSILKGDSKPLALQLSELAPLLQCVGEILGPQLAKRGG